MNEEIECKEIKPQITAAPILNESRTCLCCGEKFMVSPFIEQDLCCRCYLVVVKQLFNKENDNLTIKELKEKIKNELHCV